MEQKEANLFMIELLSEWDPLQLGNDAYELEIVDCIQAVHTIDHPLQLARKIQSIYEFSFEEVIPLKECEKIAKKLCGVIKMCHANYCKNTCLFSRNKNQKCDY